MQVGAVEAVAEPSDHQYALVPKASSLDQAGGLQRMTLRGHTAGIVKILLAEGGIDVVTGAPLLPHSMPWMV